MAWLLRGADSSKTPLLLGLILWDADELWQLDAYVRALVFLCPHPHATEQSLNVPFVLFQAVRVPPSNSPICLFLQTNSLYLFLPPLSLFLSITSTVSEALVKEPRQNAKVLAAGVYRGGRANKPPASHPAGPLLLPVGSVRPTVALSECQRDSDKAIKISSSDYNGHSRLHLVCTPTLESSD